MVPTRLSKPVAVAKGIPRRLVKGRKDRTESRVKQQVRAIVADRDGDCRLQNVGMGVCGGSSEWAHLEELRRSQTRGMAPEIRHSTDGSIMLCTLHHRRYDAHAIRVEFLTKKGADGRLAFYADRYVHIEPRRDR